MHAEFARALEAQRQLRGVNMLRRRHYGPKTSSQIHHPTISLRSRSWDISQSYAYVSSLYSNTCMGWIHLISTFVCPSTCNWSVNCMMSAGTGCLGVVTSRSNKFTAHNKVKLFIVTFSYSILGVVLFCYLEVRGL
jgi:hypothetical protein